jgi:hypothetical protein
MSKKDKGRLPQFVPLLVATIDSPAWRATSHGARSLYISLKRRVPKGRNRAFLSYRDAKQELQCSHSSIRKWFKELEHYGFIVLAQHGCLGVEGKGQAPHWRLTEMGATSKASSEGIFEPPTNDFLRWDGILFEWNGKADLRFRHLQKTKPRYSRGEHPATDGGNTPATHVVAPKRGSATDGGNIGNDLTATHVGNITSITTIGGSLAVSSEPLNEVSDHFGSRGFDDPRIVSLKRWGRAHRPWTKPTIISDEPRDLTRYPEVAAS